MIYTLGSEKPVFIDGRADMYGVEIFTDYKKIVQVDEEVDALLNRYDINFVLYPLNSSLIRYLKVQGSWIEIYSDNLASILIRK